MRAVFGLGILIVTWQVNLLAAEVVDLRAAIDVYHQEDCQNVTLGDHHLATIERVELFINQEQWCPSLVRDLLLDPVETTKYRQILSSAKSKAKAWSKCRGAYNSFIKFQDDLLERVGNNLPRDSDGQSCSNASVATIQDETKLRGLRFSNFIAQDGVRIYRNPLYQITTRGIERFTPLVVVGEFSLGSESWFRVEPQFTRLRKQGWVRKEDVEYVFEFD